MTVFRFMPCCRRKPSKKLSVHPGIGRDKYETRPKLSIALDSTRRYLELACDQVLSMFYIGVVDTNYKDLGGLGRLDGLSVRNVKSLGLEFPAYIHRVTANRHVACTHIVKKPQILRTRDAVRYGIRAPSSAHKIAHLRRCPPRNDFTEREVLCGTRQDGPRQPQDLIPGVRGKPKGAENCLNAFGANVLYALRVSHNTRKVFGRGRRLCAWACLPNYLDLDYGAASC